MTHIFCRSGFPAGNFAKVLRPTTFSTRDREVLEGTYCLTDLKREIFQVDFEERTCLAALHIEDEDDGQNFATDQKSKSGVQ